MKTKGDKRKYMKIEGDRRHLSSIFVAKPHIFLYLPLTSK